MPAARGSGIDVTTPSVECDRGWVVGTVEGYNRGYARLGYECDDENLRRSGDSSSSAACRTPVISLRKAVTSMVRGRGHPDHWSSSSAITMVAGL